MRLRERKRAEALARRPDGADGGREGGGRDRGYMRTKSKRKIGQRRRSCRLEGRYQWSLWRGRDNVYMHTNIAGFALILKKTIF